MRSVRSLAVRPALAILFLLAGALAPAAVGGLAARQLIWAAGLVLLGAPLVWRTAVGIFRGQLAADVVASLALVGAIGLNQPAVGLVIVLMQTGGEALEQAAAARASRAVAELEAEAPRVAHVEKGSTVIDIPVAQVAIGDRLLVRPGEMIPCDGIVRDSRTSLDTSRITGEPLPRQVVPGDAVASGAINLDRPVIVEATASAAASLYQGIVELVRSAQASKAPIQRLADRAAVWFTPATLIVCGIAFLVSGDANRVLAVLVVATPCPLILAAPVAFLGGINRAARHQIVVRHGTALEQLASVDSVVFDKTGTLTVGHPVVDRVDALGSINRDDLLRLAGSVERGSGHLLARSVVTAAEALGPLAPADQVIESAGRGVTGMVTNQRVTVGAFTLMEEWEPEAAAGFAAAPDGPGLKAYVAVDRAAAGTVTFADRTRESARSMLEGLDALGISSRTVLSGDRTVNVLSAAAGLGISEAIGDLLPQDKVGFVARQVKRGRRVMMIGDGANDAPALAAATVGVAIAAHGGGITAEAADVVLLTDDLTRVPEAVAIARRTMRVARQSIGVGLALSLVAMGFAAAGAIVPIVGAVIQEAIDVAVIVNALRVLTPDRAEIELHSLFERG
jgi:heavy metal translocating P-type ATPase